MYHHRGDIAVEVLVQVLPPRARTVWAWIVDALCVATFLVIGWYGVQLIRLQWPVRTPGVGIPTALYTAPVVIGAAIMIAHVCAQRLRHLARGA